MYAPYAQFQSFNICKQVNAYVWFLWNYDVNEEEKYVITHEGEETSCEKHSRFIQSIPLVFFFQGCVRVRVKNFHILLLDSHLLSCAH